MTSLVVAVAVTLFICVAWQIHAAYIIPELTHYPLMNCICLAIVWMQR